MTEEFDQDLFKFLQTHFKTYESCVGGGYYHIRIRKVNGDEWYETMKTLSTNGHLSYYRLRRDYVQGFADFSIEYKFTSKINPTLAFFKI